MSIVDVLKLKMEQGSKKSELANMQKRLKQVQAVIDSLGSAFSDNVSDINKKTSSAASSLSGGLKGLSKVDDVMGIFSRKKEAYSDAFLESARNDLISERRRINERINRLQGEIGRLDTKISEAKDD